MAESASDAVLCLATDGTILFWNRAAERLFGYSRAEALGQSITRIVPDDDLARDLSGVAGTTLTRNARRADGSVLVVDLTLASAEDGGRPVFTAVLRDVSDRVAMEDLALQREQDYRRLFEYAHDAILILDPETERVLAANRSACELYGMKYRELVGRSLESLSVHPEEGKRHVAATLQAGGRHLFTTEQTRSDGTRIELEIAAALIHYQGAEAILSINRDVTARNAAQRELARERDFVSRVLDIAGSLVVVLDRDGRIVRFNHACERASGYQAEEVLGRPLWEVAIPPSRVAEMRAEFDRLSAGNLPSTFENVWQRRDGTLRRISWANTAIVDGGGVTEFVVCTGIDVTETREVEEQLAIARRLSELGEVAASVAHEFNNVLMGIAPFAEVLQKRAGADPLIERATTHINRALGRGKAIASEILRYAQPAEPVRERIPIGDFLSEIRRDVAPLVGEKVDLSVEAAGDVVVLADPVQLHQVLSNLVLNARDAMPGGGRITIDVARGTAAAPEFGVIRDPARFAHLRVCDEGTGMSSETLQRLFQPLFTRKKSGVGLGLAVTYQIVRKHGGYIFAVSEPGHGTTFHVYLPLADAPGG